MDHILNALPISMNDLKRVKEEIEADFITLVKSLGTMGLPDYNNPIEITELPYTCPENGVVIANPNWTGGGASLFVKMTPKDSTETYTWLSQNNTSESGQRSAGQLIVREGDVISLSVSPSTVDTSVKKRFEQLNFFPFKK